MKKSACFVLLTLVLFSSSVTALPQAAREATIEAETKARIVLQSQLNSKLNERGDTVTAILYEPIYVEGQLVLPRGTEFHGRVTEAVPAGRGQKNGKLTIIFERMAMPWGEEPVALAITSIDDWDNNEKMKADEEGKVSGKRSGKRTAENTRTGGEIGTAAGLGTILVGGGSTAGGIGILGGLAGGVLLTKGGEVRVNPGAIFRVKFVKPITLPVIGQAPGAPQPIQQESQPEPVKKP